MSIRDRKWCITNDLYEGLSVFDRMFTIPSYTFTGFGIVDPEKYDVVPKQSYLEQAIKNKEEEIAENERAMQASQRYYQSVKDRLIQEKETLISQRKKK